MSYCFCVWVKNPPTNAGDAGDKGSIPGPGRSPSGGTGPLQCSCLENSMDRGAWRAAVHGVTGSHTTKQLSKHPRTYHFIHTVFMCVFSDFFRFLNTVKREDLEKAMAPHSSTLAWKIPWTEEPGGLQSMGWLGV